VSEILGAVPQVSQPQTRVRGAVLPLDAGAHHGGVSVVRRLEGWQTDSEHLKRKINISKPGEEEDEHGALLRGKSCSLKLAGML